MSHSTGDLRSPEQLSAGRLVMLHLAPGVVATVLYVALAGPLAAAGLPPLFALLVALATVIVPFEMLIVLRAGGLAAIPYRAALRGRDWAILVPALTAVAVIAFGVVALVEAPLREQLFGWLPGWFLEPIPVDAVGDYSTGAWIFTLGLYAALNVVAGPIVEELYFRGYLLPRMSRFGRWAPLVNVTLFSLYHFWSPWQLLSRVAGVAPLAYAVWWKRSVGLGIAVHVLLNGIGTASVIALVLQRLD